ncbi:hypothetical protein A1O1_06805 [Capronia coronata CBS 617.96]|uniref:Uncharacterized protein n=1 Tax=Capronia coronata CBS 617.96 TaxID=1182541 RepID=W9Y1R3_9EURO|nr:uncharacterized protein A1O1_06805 [Capronia coronata CBS 617.96]EXJ83186.1 hypothetical protein A1O1_06805 [Capronia coronata CBS 617.96]
MAINPEYQTSMEDGMLVPVRHPFYRRTGNPLRDLVDDINFPHFCYKAVAYTYVLTILWGFYMILPLPGHWSTDGQPDNVTIFSRDYTNYFDVFKVSSACHLQAPDLYLPAIDAIPSLNGSSYCSTRLGFLSAISEGNTSSPDIQHWVQGCRYPWYSIDEICTIIGRFSAIIFVGDSSLQSIYNGFNILLRQDLVNGCLATWDMPDGAQLHCRCENQFTEPFCVKYFVNSSLQLPPQSWRADRRDKYHCDRSTRHEYLEVNYSPAPTTVLDKLDSLITRPGPSASQRKPVAIVHGLSPDSLPVERAAASVFEFKHRASSLTANALMLWIGPGATGTREPLNDDRDREIRAFDEYMALSAARFGVDVLGMWKATFHAWSLDGPRSQEKLAITQAMMVVNWLSWLEAR